MDAAARHRLREAMARLADGERAAFDEVYAGLWPLARGFGRRLAGDLGEDAAQAALLKLFENAHRYRRGADPAAWLLALVGWEVRTLQRRAERRREAPLDDAPTESVSAPHAEVERRDLLAAALDALGHLREEDRALILDAVEDGRGPPLNPTQRKRRQRAFGRLRAAYRRIHG